MADRPALYYLDGLRKLRGEPHISSPENNAGVLKSERVFTKPRTWTRPDYLSAEPDAKLAEKGCVLTHIEETGGDNLNVELYLVYETLPGTVLVGTQLDERGDTQTVFTQIVVKGTPADGSTLLQEGSVEAVDNVRGRKRTTSVASHSTLTGGEFDEDGAAITTSDDIVAPGTAPADGLLVVSDTVEPLTKQKSRRTRKTVTAHPVITTQRRNERGDLETVAEQTVDPSTAPAADGLLVTEATITGRTATKSRKRTATVAAHSALVGAEFNERGELVTITDNIVAPGTAPADGLLVESDSVTPLSATKAKRVRKTVAGRIPLKTVENRKVGRQETLIPAKFLGADTLTITTQIVDPSTAPTPLSTTLVSSIVAQQSATKALRTDTTRPENPYPTLGGSEMSNFAGGQAAASVDKIVPAGTAAQTGFGILSSEVTPIDANSSELRTSSVTSFPLLSGSEAGRPASEFPGIYGNGDGGGEEYEEQIVPTGGSPMGPWPTGYGVLSRQPINQYEQRVRVGVRASESGVSEYITSGEAPDGSVTTTYRNLGGNFHQPGFLTLSTETRPLSGGKTESVYTTTSGFHALTETEYRVDVPARFLAGLALVENVDRVDPDTPPDSGADVLFSKVEPDDGKYYRSKRTTRRLPSGLTIPGLAPLVTKESGGDARGAEVTVTESIVQGGTPLPADGLTVLVKRDEPLGGGYCLRTLRNLSGTQFYVLEDYDIFDPELGVGIHEKQEIVSVSAVVAPGAPSGGVCVTYKSIDNKKSIKITRTLMVPGGIRDTYGQAGWQRPGILNVLVDFDTTGRAPKIAEVTEKARSYLGATRIVRTIGTGLTGDATADPYTGYDVSYSGGISFSLSDMLTNVPIVITDDNVTVTIPVTSPSASTYIGSIGSEIVIASRVRDYHFGLQIKETTHLTIK